MPKAEKPVLYLGVLPAKPDPVLVALQAAEMLLDSVAFVKVEGDTIKPLKQIRAAIKKVSLSKKKR